LKKEEKLKKIKLANHVVGKSTFFDFFPDSSTSRFRSKIPFLDTFSTRRGPRRSTDTAEVFLGLVNPEDYGDFTLPPNIVRGLIELPRDIVENLPLPAPLKDYFPAPPQAPPGGTANDDNKYVIKLADAVRIVREQLTDRLFMEGVVQDILEHAGPFPPSTGEDNPLAGRIIESLRANVLQQQNARRTRHNPKKPWERAGHLHGS
jgi:hypothetical protein